MASPSKRFAGKALRPRPRFEGRSPAAIARRCGAILALLALAGCQQLIVLHPKGVVGEGTSTLLIDSFIIMSLSSFLLSSRRSYSDGGTDRPTSGLTSSRALLSPVRSNLSPGPFRC